LELVITIIALTMLCVPAFAQTTAEDWFNKGVALAAQDKYDEALQAYDRAIELNPQDAIAWHNKGLTLYRLGEGD